MGSYYIIKSNGSVESMPDNYWFTNPIRKEGKNHEWMCEQTPCRLIFYKYGIKSDYEFKGWIIKNDIRISDGEYLYHYRGGHGSGRLEDVCFEATSPQRISYKICIRMKHFTFQRLFLALNELVRLTHEDITFFGYKKYQDKVYSLTMGDPKHMSGFKHCPVYFD